MGGLPQFIEAGGLISRQVPQVIYIVIIFFKKFLFFLPSKYNINNHIFVNRYDYGFIRHCLPRGYAKGQVQGRTSLLNLQIVVSFNWDQ